MHIEANYLEDNCLPHVNHVELSLAYCKSDVDIVYFYYKTNYRLKSVHAGRLGSSQVFKDWSVGIMSMGVML